MIEPTATLEISQNLRAAEPIGETVTLLVDPSGFHDPSGVGAGGEVIQAFDVKDVASMLLDNFDAAGIRALFGQFARVHALLIGDS